MRGGISLLRACVYVLLTHFIIHNMPFPLPINPLFCLFLFPIFILITLEMKEYTKISIDFTFEQLFFLHSFAQGTVFHADANCPLINLFVSVCVVNNSKEGNFSSSNRGSHSPQDFNFVQKLVLIEK